MLEKARPKRRKPLPEVLTIDETRKLIDAIKLPRLRMAAVAAYSCGLRKEELERVDISWICADSKALHIHDGKGGVDRIVPLPPRTLDLLREHWARESHSTDLIFESSRGSTLCADTLRRAIKAAAKDVGITRVVYLHTLRHCYASHLLELGVPLPLIQCWLGHKHLSTTLVYARITPALQSRAVSSLDELTRRF